MCFSNWFKKKNKDLDGKITPKQGITLFHWDSAKDLVFKMNLHWIRYAIDENCKTADVVNFCKLARQKGLQVLLCCVHKSNPYMVQILAENYARQLGNQVAYQIHNEPNSNTDGFLPALRFADIMKSTYLCLKDYGNPTVVMGGLNGLEKNVVEYYEQLLDKGLYSDWHCFHFYDELRDTFYKIRDICLSKNKPFVITEYGTNNSNEARKIENYDKFNNQFMKNKVGISFIYALWGGNTFSIADRPKLFAHIKNRSW